MKSRMQSNIYICMNVLKYNKKITRVDMRKRQGFTLAELLIVVAIIAVLVGIAIPVFTSQLEKAREATDAANIRDAYAEVMTKAISTGEQSTITVSLTQKKNGWQTTFKFPCEEVGEPKVNGKAIVSYKSGAAVITYDGENSSDIKNTLDAIKEKASIYDYEKIKSYEGNSKRGTLYTEDRKTFYIVEQEKHFKDFEETLDEKHGLRRVDFTSVKNVDHLNQIIDDLSHGCIVHDISTDRYYVYTGSNGKMDIREQGENLIALH